VVFNSVGLLMMPISESSFVIDSEGGLVISKYGSRVLALDCSMWTLNSTICTRSSALNAMNKTDYAYALGLNIQKEKQN